MKHLLLFSVLLALLAPTMAYGFKVQVGVTNYCPHHIVWVQEYEKTPITAKIGFQQSKTAVVESRGEDVILEFMTAPKDDPQNTTRRGGVTYTEDEILTMEFIMPTYSDSCVPVIK